MAPVYNGIRVFNAKGFSLIELVVTMVVIGISLSAILSVLTPGLSRSADPIWQARGVELIEAYLDEIKAMRFDENTPIGGGFVDACDLTAEGESRNQFDDVGDYNGLNDSPPQLLIGTLGADYSGFQIQVTVSCVGTNFGFPSDNYAKRINVTLTGPSGEQLQMAMHKGNF
jgi:MSHA pilin protein MshD